MVGPLDMMIQASQCLDHINSKCRNDDRVRVRMMEPDDYDDVVQCFYDGFEENLANSPNCHVAQRITSFLAKVRETGGPYKTGNEVGSDKLAYNPDHFDPAICCTFEIVSYNVDTGYVLGAVKLIYFIQDNVAQLERLTVRKDSRRMGVGEKLTQTAVSLGKRLVGITGRIYLDTLNVFHGPINLYKKCGFRIVRSIAFDDVPKDTFERCHVVELEFCRTEL
eukprot:CFRG3229T1